MIRRNARLRREYLYRKSVQSNERERLDRKVRIREALEKGTPISEKDLIEYSKENEFGITNEETKKRKFEIEVDDEYQQAGLEDPKILLTTAHDPSDRLQRFAKELKYLFPNSQRINRGTQTLGQIVEAGNTNGFTDLVVLNENRGEPDGLIICHLPYGPTAYFTIFNSVMRHETNIDSNISQAYPHLRERVATILKYLFPVPKEDSRRIVTFANDNDFISFRHHVYKKEKGKVVLKEVGPRFELQLYEIKLGTLDQRDAESEWVFRPYMNNAGKKQNIGKSKTDLVLEKLEEE